MCRQLGIVTFHPKVEPWRGNRKKLSGSPCSTPIIPQPQTSEPSQEEVIPDAKVPLVRVNLIQCVHLLPHQSEVVEIGLDCQDISTPLLLDGSQLNCGVDVEASLINVTEDGVALTVLSNTSGNLVTVDEGRRSCRTS